MAIERGGRARFAAPAMNPSFRAVTQKEVTEAYGLYLQVVAWLGARGIRQWLRPLSREEFSERQEREELFAYFDGERMLAIVSLAFELDTDWKQHLSPEKRWWIKSLAVSRVHGGRAVGENVIQQCEAHLSAAGATEAWLECVDTGFLPGYYARLGYETVKRADITYSSGNTFPVVLMRKHLAQFNRKERRNLEGPTPRG
jgi:ribosomal protein S18 acetylase RimI-like enzyme